MNDVFNSAKREGAISDFNKRLAAGEATKQPKKVSSIKKAKKEGKPGRPVVRFDRQKKKSAAKRTNEGEERYTFTIKSEDIQTMKGLADQQGILLKEAYQAAIDLYKKQFEIK